MPCLQYNIIMLLIQPRPDSIARNRRSPGDREHWRRHLYLFIKHKVTRLDGEVGFTVLADSSRVIHSVLFNRWYILSRLPAMRIFTRWSPSNLKAARQSRVMRNEYLPTSGGPNGFV